MIFQNKFEIVDARDKLFASFCIIVWYIFQRPWIPAEFAKYLEDEKDSIDRLQLRSEVNFLFFAKGTLSAS